MIPGGGTSIDGGHGKIYVANANTGWYYEGDGWGKSWTALGTSGAVEIGANMNNDWCIVKTHDNTNGGPLVCNHEALGGGARLDKIDVMDNGMPIGVAKDGGAWKASGTYANPTWTSLGTGYIDLAVGPNNIIWGVMNAANDYKIIYDVGGAGQKVIPGAAKRISVDNWNVAFVIGSTSNELFKWTGPEALVGVATNTAYKSRHYKYQKRDCFMGVCHGYPWRDTDFRWCVDSEMFGFTLTPAYGGNMYYDDDRIYDLGVERNVRCQDRKDIGDCVLHESIANGHTEIYKC